MSLSTARRVTDDEEQTLAIGRALGRHAEPGLLLGLVGPLGAGKTLLARGLFLGLGLDMDRWSGSPTYVLACRYDGPLPLVHSDFYRLASATEACELALDEQAREGALVVVEWADRFPEALPCERVDITMRVVGLESRELEFVAHTPRAATWLGRALEEIPGS